MNNKFRTIVNTLNKRAYKYPVEDFTCVGCGKKTFLDESYSDHGNNLMCTQCVDNWSKRLRMSRIDFVRCYIWKS